jgi:hypothetical protein
MVPGDPHLHCRLITLLINPVHSIAMGLGTTIYECHQEVPHRQGELYAERLPHSRSESGQAQAF